MQVAYFINSLGSGGAQRQIVELAVSLRHRHGIDTRVYVYFDDDFFAKRLERAGVPVVLLPKTHALDPAFVFRLRRQILEDAPDIIHGFLWGSCRWLVPALLSIPRSKRPLFIAAERADEVAKTLGMDLSQRLVYRFADLTTVNAEPVIDEFESKLSIPRSSMTYLPNGIDLEAWDTALRAESPLDFEPGKFHVAVIGRIELQKNHPHLLRALSLLDKEVLDRMKVWLIGRNPGGDYPTALEEEIRSRALSGVVELIQPQERIAPVMAGVDAVVLTSTFEGFPNVIMEAMASRTAVVGTDVGDNMNIIAEGECGFIVPVNDEATLAERLLTLFEMEPATREAMGARGRTIVEEKFEMHRIADAHLDLYRKLLPS